MLLFFSVIPEITDIPNTIRIDCHMVNGSKLLYKASM
jgi:hypothetical protein